MQEHKLKVARLDQIFVTRMNWANVGGLSGLILTLRDTGLPKCDLSGPPQLQNYLEAIKVFSGSLQGIDLAVRPFTEPEYQDDTMMVYQVPIISSKAVDVNSAGGVSSQRFPGRESPKQKLHSAQKDSGLPTGKSSQTPGRWERIVTRDPSLVVSFICKLHDKKGNFLVLKAKEFGLPVGTPAIGPIIAQLKAGKSINFEGKEIFPGDVCTPAEPGPVFMVVECPSEDFITPITENETFRSYQEGESKSSVVLVIHITPEPILHNSSYRQWMDRFGPQTEHLILNEKSSTVHNLRSYKTQAQLNLVHSAIFPQLTPFQREEEETDFFGVRGECLLKYQLRPKLEWQRDAVIENNSAEFVKEAMDLPGFEEALKECKQLLASYSVASNDMTVLHLAFGTTTGYGTFPYLGPYLYLPRLFPDISSQVVVYFVLSEASVISKNTTTGCENLTQMHPCLNAKPLDIDVFTKYLTAIRQLELGSCKLIVIQPLRYYFISISP
ncbi:zinc phosphodiesterase ELAC 2 [Pelobates cultripes]|uniref:ribonuclease Z n=1 Tax=Pelobates cultripes TaxID=61616 RepID=A0AAD1W7B9_PELCU|nr:zinc phosphodiesterase ELAC 2 [Pelobates cultripes]